MRLLFDANLSPTLVGSLADLYPRSAHVFDIGDIASNDAMVWQVAARDGFLITTKDTEFLDLSLLRGAPPKFVLLRVGNVPTSLVAGLLRARCSRIRQFAADALEAVLVVER